MATTPSTIVIFTEDKLNLPLQDLMVIIKQIFQYGVREISLKGDKIFLSLSYCPKKTSLRAKFGNLPVRYFRAQLNSEEEFKVLERAVKNYRFNILDEQPDDVEEVYKKMITREGGSGSRKRKFYAQPIMDVESDDGNNNNDDDNDDHDDDNADEVDVEIKKMLKRRQQHRRSSQQQKTNDSGMGSSSSFGCDNDVK